MTDKIKEISGFTAAATMLAAGFAFVVLAVAGAVMLTTVAALMSANQFTRIRRTSR